MQIASMFALTLFFRDARGGQPVADYNEAHSDTITTVRNRILVCSFYVLFVA